LMVSNLRCYICRNRGVTTRYITARRTTDYGLRTRDHGTTGRVSELRNQLIFSG
jgi:hypothetical protein